ncbi:MAG TPA: hypothetical protein VGH33_27035, partial [Isosphaeraceae bacterium]
MGGFREQRPVVVSKAKAIPAEPERQAAGPCFQGWTRGVMMETDQPPVEFVRAGSGLPPAPSPSGCSMDWLSIAGNVTSVIGLAVSGYTLYKVQSLPETLRHHSRSRQLSELIDKIVKLPSRKSTIGETTTLEVELILHTVRLYYVSPHHSKNRELK